LNITIPDNLTKKIYPANQTVSAKQNKKPKSTTNSELPVDRYINRELSWLEFNQRVLDQAANTTLPILERAKFLAITSSNLDEFMMVRVGSLKMQYDRNSLVRDPSGRTVSEQLQAVAARCRIIVARQYQVLHRWSHC
jgi:polyphosphate kinase